MHFEAEAGCWRINYRSPQGGVLTDLVHAVVWPQGPHAPGAAGQWLADVNPGAHKNQVPSLLRAIACRLGLLPVHFAPDFEVALMDERPICIVADTNAIYQGSIYQALRLRRGKPTTVFVPDQVFMELQRRRGRKLVKPSDVMELLVVQNARLNLPLVGSRVLTRIRNGLRYVVHQARPPEAMVRYFGSEAGDRGEDESSLVPESAAPSFQRDRLILEVVRYTPTLLPPGIPVWFLTGDADLAAQASCEGFHVGFSWVLDRPDRFCLTSPHLDARTGTIQHVAWSEFVEEFTWNLGRILIQKVKDPNATELRLPEPRDRILGERGFAWPESSIQKLKFSRWEIPVNSPILPPNTGDSRGAPRKAPAAQSLVKFLLASAVDAGVEHDSVFEPVRPYLSALQWATVTAGKFMASERGQKLAASWQALKRDSVEEHAAWLKEAAIDLLKLQPVQTFIAALFNKSSYDEGDLVKSLGWSSKDVQAMGKFLTSFACIVRSAGKYWYVRVVDPSDAVAILLRQLEELKRQGLVSNGFVRVDTLYHHLLKTEPLSLIDFRVALWALFKQGRIRTGGSAPPVGKSEKLHVELLLPDASGEPSVEPIDLSAGDFLLPGQSSQALQIEET